MNVFLHIIADVDTDRVYTVRIWVIPDNHVRIAAEMKKNVSGWGFTLYN